MGELKNAFALVRPPGHMAERSEAKVGCYFNNVAIAAKYLTTQKLSNRVLIVDWVSYLLYYCRTLNVPFPYLIIHKDITAVMRSPR